MTLTSKVAQAERKLTGRPVLRVLVVKDAWYLTPNMIRVVFAGPELDGFPSGRDGGAPGPSAREWACSCSGSSTGGSARSSARRPAPTRASDEALDARGAQSLRPWARGRGLEL